MLKSLKCRLRRKHEIACFKSFNLDTREVTHTHQCMRCTRIWNYESEPLPESLASVLEGIERAKQRGYAYQPTNSEIAHARKDLLN